MDAAISTGTLIRYALTTLGIFVLIFALTLITPWLAKKVDAWLARYREKHADELQQKKNYGVRSIYELPPEPDEPEAALPPEPENLPELPENAEDAEDALALKIQQLKKEKNQTPPQNAAHDAGFINICGLLSGEKETAVIPDSAFDLTSEMIYEEEKLLAKMPKMPEQPASIPAVSSVQKIPAAQTPEELSIPEDVSAAPEEISVPEDVPAVPQETFAQESLPETHQDTDWNTYPDADAAPEQAAAPAELPEKPFYLQDIPDFYDDEEEDDEPETAPVQMQEFADDYADIEDEDFSALEENRIFHGFTEDFSDDEAYGENADEPAHFRAFTEDFSDDPDDDESAAFTEEFLYEPEIYEDSYEDVDAEEVLPPEYDESAYSQAKEVLGKLLERLIDEPEHKTYRLWEEDYDEEDDFYDEEDDGFYEEDEEDDNGGWYRP